MFTTIPDFNGSSFKEVCPVTNLPKQRGDDYSQPQDIDEFIIRGPEILYYDGRGEVSLGHFDFRPAALAEAAERILGYVPAQEYTDTYVALEAERDANGRLQERLAVLVDRCTELTLQNAELVQAAEAAAADAAAGTPAAEDES